MKKILALILSMVLIISSISTSLFTVHAATGVTSSTNYTKLKNYINTYGKTNDSGNKWLVYTSSTDSMIFYYYIESKSSGILFGLLTDSDDSSRVVHTMEFLLTSSSRYISVDMDVFYYRYSSCLDAVSGTKSVDRSAYTGSNTYTLSNKGSYITASQFSDMFSSSLQLLCKFWDVQLYSSLGIGLEELGFVSYSGKGSKVCDTPSSYHTGSSVTQNAYSATCTTDGYTGDIYCSSCGEKKASGSVISSVGYHTYDNDCDSICNVCNQTRTVVGHQYDNDRDITCNTCGDIREVILNENGPQIVVESVNGKPGETVKVNINVKNNPGIASMALDIEYDSILTLTNIEYNSNVDGTYTLPSTMESPVKLNWVNTENATEDWTFATLTFTVSENAEAGSVADVSVTYDENDIYDFDTEANIYFQIVDGKVNVTKHLPGDINGDGNINNKDVTRLLKYLTGWDVEFEENSLDVNGDGSINNKDVTRLLKYLTGWDVKIY